MGHNWVFFPDSECRPTVMLNSFKAYKLRYLKNLKLFATIKDIIIWAYSFAKEKKFLLSSFRSILLRKRSLSNARWFYGQSTKFWREICKKVQSSNFYKQGVSYER